MFRDILHKICMCLSLFYEEDWEKKISVWIVRTSQRHNKRLGDVTAAKVGARRSEGF